MSAQPPLLGVHGLVVRIGPRTLVQGLSMQAFAGQVWCILGANGAGKSTFLDTVVGLRCPDGGSIHLAGRPAGDWSPLEAARVRAYLPQSMRDAFSATLLDVVLMGRHPHLSRWAWEDEPERRIALAALHAVGLADMAGRDITTLSGGERQRAAIAALIAQDTPLLLLDEPVAHLDLRHQTMILEHLRRLAFERERAVVFSVHDLNLAARFATHAMLFHGNGAVEAGPVGEVMTDEALSGALHCGVARIDVGPRSLFVAA